MASKGGKDLFKRQCGEALEEALVEFGFSRKRAGEISCSDFMGRGAVIPFRYGLLEINKGALQRAVKQNGA